MTKFNHLSNEELRRRLESLNAIQQGVSRSLEALIAHVAMHGEYTPEQVVEYRRFSAEQNLMHSAMVRLELEITDRNYAADLSLGPTGGPIGDGPADGPIEDIQ